MGTASEASPKAWERHNEACVLADGCLVPSDMFPEVNLWVVGHRVRFMDGASLASEMEALGTVHFREAALFFGFLELCNDFFIFKRILRKEVPFLERGCD